MKMSERLAETSIVKVIEYIVAYSTLVGSIVLFTPLVVVPVYPAASPLVATIVSQPGIIILGIVALVSAIMMLVGLYKNKYSWRSAGLFINALVRMYVLIATFLIGEPIFPWEAQFVMFFIVIALWLNQRYWAKLRL